MTTWRGTAPAPTRATYLDLTYQGHKVFVLANKIELSELQVRTTARGATSPMRARVAIR